MGDPAVEALSCIAPQGIDGCGFESPLEAMAQALNPDAAWNTAERPFLRPGGVLAIVILTDEVDCSHNPAHDAIFTTNKVFWHDPEIGRAHV